MDIDKVKEILIDLPRKVLEMDDGDLVLISDIIDDISYLASHLRKNKYARLLLDILE